MDEIDCKTVIGMLERSEPCYLLDVREADEYEEGHIPGTVWIPLGDLPERVDELPKDQPIIAICHSGGRSAMATRFLNSQGFHTKNMVGGMLDWTGPVTR